MSRAATTWRRWRIRRSARFGKVNILCNNAGVGGSPGASWELSAEDWQWVIDVDLWSVIHGVRNFVRG